MYIAIQQFDSLDVNGQVVSTSPEVLVQVDVQNMWQGDLLRLGQRVYRSRGTDRQDLTEQHYQTMGSIRLGKIGQVSISESQSQKGSVP
ncbi:hypothetical protein ACFFGR_08735 [Arthrobacter liuii]|uniref:Uncharacterized protein n=1 Tax=Arthrobacter liuii TaxID=1476996 RepID=A0ABQ2AU36_9MICC|nr:hypothetical protein [Arthrobacter liuii]GGH97609.1 hypothetical protein GCM10007170_28250 [Arthrobacter liuii]